MTGSLEGTLWGAFSAATFYGIGQKFGGNLGEGMGVMGSRYSKAGLARATAVHGVAGGTLSKLQGGRFGHGLASARSEEHTSELQSRGHLVCRLLLEKKKQQPIEKRQPNLTTTKIYHT